MSHSSRKDARSMKSVETQAVPPVDVQGQSVAPIINRAVAPHRMCDVCGGVGKVYHTEQKGAMVCRYLICQDCKATWRRDFSRQEPID